MFAPTSINLGRLTSRSVAGPSQLASALQLSIRPPRLVRSLADAPPTPTFLDAAPAPATAADKEAKKAAMVKLPGNKWRSKSTEPKKRPVQDKTPSIPISQLGLDYSFSTIPPSELASRLATHTALHTPTQLAALSPADRSRHTAITHILTKSLKMDSPARRREYFLGVEATSIRRPDEEIQKGRREKAEEEIAMGWFEEDDKLSWEAYEEKIETEERGKIEAIEKKTEGEGKEKERALMIKALKRKFDLAKKRAKVRREVLAERAGSQS